MAPPRRSSLSRLEELCPSLARGYYAPSLSSYSAAFHPSCGPLPMFPPPVCELEQRNAPISAGCIEPFICSISSGLPRGVPDDIDELIASYMLSGVSKRPPSIDVDFETLEFTSNGQARRALAAASAEGKTLWAAIHTHIEHPHWWPAGKGAEPVRKMYHRLLMLTSFLHSPPLVISSSCLRHTSPSHHRLLMHVLALSHDILMLATYHSFLCWLAAPSSCAPCDTLLWLLHPTHGCECPPGAGI